MPTAGHQADTRKDLTSRRNPPGVAGQWFADIYADDADFVNVIGMRWKGASQIAQMHVLLHESRMRQTTLASEDLTIRVLAPSVAVVHDTWVLTGDPGAPGWKVGERRRGILVHVLKLDGAGKWHIAVSQNTDIQDLPNT